MIGTGFLFLLIMISFTMSDMISRGWLGVPGKVAPGRRGRFESGPDTTLLEDDRMQLDELRPSLIPSRRCPGRSRNPRDVRSPLQNPAGLSH